MISWDIFLKDELSMADAQENSYRGGLQVCVVSCMLLCWQRLSFTKQANWPLKKSHDTTRDNTLLWKMDQNGSNEHSGHLKQISIDALNEIIHAKSFDHLWGIWYAAAPLRHFGRTRLGFATKFDSSAWVLRNTGVKDVKVCRVCDGLSMFELGKPRKTYENLP